MFTYEQIPGTNTYRQVCDNPMFRATFKAMDGRRTRVMVKWLRRRMARGWPVDEVERLRYISEPIKPQFWSKVRFFFRQPIRRLLGKE